MLLGFLNKICCKDFIRLLVRLFKKHSIMKVTACSGKLKLIIKNAYFQFYEMSRTAINTIQNILKVIVRKFLITYVIIYG